MEVFTDRNQAAKYFASVDSGAAVLEEDGYRTKIIKDPDDYSSVIRVTHALIRGELSGFPITNDDIDGIKKLMQTFRLKVPEDFDNWLDTQRDLAEQEIDY